MADPIDVNTLANIVNSDWGNSSMAKGGKDIFSIKAKVIGNTVEVVFTTIATFASEQVLRGQMPQYDAESIQAIDAYVKLMKERYKESVGTALPCKQRNTFANIEHIYLNPYTPVKRAYYRRHVIYDL